MMRHPLPLTIAFGALAGALGGLMGVGGGIVLVPLLIQFLGATQHAAQAASLAFVVATALVAAVPYLASEHLDLPLAALLAIGAVPGVLAGVRLAKRTPGPRLRRAFGVVMFATAIRLLAAPPEPTVAAAIWAWPWNVLLGCGVGFLAGLLGVGGGVMLVPVLVLGERVPQHTAQGISLLLVAPVGLIGALSYARHGHLATRSLPGLLIGGALGGAVGALGAHRIEAPLLSRLFAILLIFISAQMILRAPNARAATNSSGGVP